MFFDNYLCGRISSLSNKRSAIIFYSLAGLLYAFKTEPTFPNPAKCEPNVKTTENSAEKFRNVTRKCTTEKEVEYRQFRTRLSQNS